MEANLLVSQGHIVVPKFVTLAGKNKKNYTKPQSAGMCVWVFSVSSVSSVHTSFVSESPRTVTFHWAIYE